MFLSGTMRAPKSAPVDLKYIDVIYATIKARWSVALRLSLGHMSTWMKVQPESNKHMGEGLSLESQYVQQKILNGPTAVSMSEITSG